jgi:uncharacterized protein YbbC (DUF1343 family)
MSVLHFGEIKLRFVIVALAVILGATLSFAGDVKFGVDVLRESNFEALVGKRVGLVANPASVDSRLVSSVDVLAGTERCKLVALFGPEHGIYGAARAGVELEDAPKDPKTGVAVYSLYGKNRKPTTRVRQGLDALVFDLQDIGSRSYTYLSSMKLCMDACAESDIEFVVLDRPNPLGGNRVEGAMLQDGFKSFVSYLPVPYVHGMTMGEMAQFVQKKFYPKYTKLRVVKMSGWTREMTWEDTGRQWIPTSPHVPEARSAAAYAATGILGELYVINIGVGYTQPFELCGAPWIDGDALAHVMNAKGPKNVVFRPVHFVPFYGTFLTLPCEGVQVQFDPHTAENLVEINYRLIEALGADRIFAAAPKRHAMFDKVTGTDEARKVLTAGGDLEAVFGKWRRECEQFKTDRAGALLYP